MRKKYIAQTSQFDIYKKLYAMGYSSEQIKKSIINLLSPYIESREKLEQYAMTALALEAININIISSQSEWKDIFNFVLASYNKAREIDKHNTFAVIAYWNYDITVGQSNYSNQVKLEVGKQDRLLHLFYGEN
ncbi:hypothetical protein H6G54_12600 [Anabaena cylindrica FACHB-243]|uniref:Uncharacterized protein n=1 Tax=Anabaena cylindrica (strain ATCC 27899 / PCC 7122) TaxID=272123 RepID=K9ZFR4_ANACC|nr:MULTISPECIES: hypothetical protein [Anabaena]AFZ57584.1 hypothetical protein Anacy_2109 [Anabaena cylindrica PCC 7122]MBD2418522.1 hypothetical protein [Anabaena cylindrica FACHB-243]MBY5284974.1 hypothetical protein [Anabaena sp. CCAP 1446/1C]MCM2405051.1 hypothetical protein [Anabaena sp. CCAP 1446/1C]BAY05415.1 hypothetical protein NIES19_46880 [Anabaena cylindrica PCC 7122]